MDIEERNGVSRMIGYGQGVRNPPKGKTHVDRPGKLP